jgi:3-oxoadipate enol-lactonase
MRKSVSISLSRYSANYLTELDGARKPYVEIGDGPTPLVIVPGSADGLRTCVDVAPYLAWFYRHKASKYRLLILSRREPIPPAFGVERHADDMLRTVETLGYPPAVWSCLSAGGPIGHWAAVKRPDVVRGLVLSSSPHRVDGRTRAVLEGWLAMARQQDGSERMWRMIEPKYRPPDDVLPPGEDPVKTLLAARYDNRFERVLTEQLDLDHRELLGRVSCPALVIAGETDRVVPAASQREMAALLPKGRFVLCPGYGHFNDMENPAYQGYIDRFIDEFDLG